jgi:hypothetical protein
MHVMIAIPSYSWSVRTGTLRSLLADTVALVSRGDRFTLLDEVGNTNLQKARKNIVQAFRQSKCDALFMIDDDVCWEAGAMLNLLDRPVDFVAGVYPRRKDPLDFPVAWIPERKELVAENGLLEVAVAPGGFWRLSRECVNRMWGNYGSTLFDRVRAPGKEDEYSEDISFCGRWRALGGQVWVDPEIKMGHIGPKVFDGCLGDWLRNR